MIAVAVWGDAKFRSDAMSYMRAACDKDELRGDWKRGYRHGKGEVLLEDVRNLIVKLRALGVGPKRGGGPKPKGDWGHGCH